MEYGGSKAPSRPNFPVTRFLEGLAMVGSSETVILVHGLWMHGVVFLPYQRWLRQDGFAVSRFSYPSWRGSLTSNVEALSEFVGATPAGVIHLVGHSLGGLIILGLLANRTDPRVRRVVLLGTPCAGSHCASALAGKPLLQSIVGRAMKDWLEAPPRVLPSSLEVGVVAGTRSIGLGLLIPKLPRPNDGLIAVDETLLPDARDSIRLKVNHSGMLVSRRCATKVACFLRSGKFVDA